jgi:hypothetical protein
MYIYPLKKKHIHAHRGNQLSRVSELCYYLFLKIGFLYFRIRERERGEEEEEDVEESKCGGKKYYIITLLLVLFRVSAVRS